MAATPMSEHKHELEIAIVGAGIAGLTLAAALSLQSALKVRLYEASPSLREEGAAVGLYRNARQCLSQLSSDLRTALDRAGATEVKPATRFMMGTGEHRGEKICDVNVDGGRVVVHRTRLLKEIIKIVPENVIRYEMKINNIQEKHGKVILSFENGAVEEVDCLVGCDGLNSIVRKYVLRHETNSLAKPVFTGGFNFRTVVPLKDAIEAFGQEYCSEHVQYGWIGSGGGFCLTDFVDDGTAMQVIAGWAKDEPWPYEIPYVPWEKMRLRHDLEEWGDFGTGLAKLFTAQTELFAAAGRVHPETPTYSRNRVCVVGDAAQSMSPFLGAGAGMALEDVLALRNLLVNASQEGSDVAKVLQAYTNKRKERRLKVFRMSGEEAILLTGRAPGIGLDVAKLRDAILHDKRQEICVLTDV